MTDQLKNICVIGDVHGHLILALAMAARWQKELNLKYEAIFLCGDVGTFTKQSQLDSTTRRHAKTNPCELEFIYQWSQCPQPEWINKIFLPFEEGGLGILCPVIMIHGNHEGFEHLEKLRLDGFRLEPLSVDELPIVDSAGFIKYLPSGHVFRTVSGLLVGGIGGIQIGSRYAEYHNMAFIDEDAVENLLFFGRLDLLISHQGPAVVQGEEGAAILDLLFHEKLAEVWCHAHSIPNPVIKSYDGNLNTLIVPLGDVAFTKTNGYLDSPGENAWSIIQFSEGINVIRGKPDFWRDFRFKKWKLVNENMFVLSELL